MALTESSAKRKDDTTGKDIKTFLDGTDHIQGVVIVDDSGNQAGIAGNPLDVDVVSALPAGANAIGKLAANSGVDIGDVDVTSVVPGVAAASLGKAEDAAHASGDVGVMALAVRKDTPAATGGDGDYEPLQTKGGRLHVTQSDVQKDDTDKLAVSNNIVPAGSWTTLVDAVRLDDDPTSYNSAALDVAGHGAAWILIDIDSTLAPTDVRVLAQFSDDGGTTWWDFEEGLWASLYWEDTDTAAGVAKAFLLPCGGIDDIRIRVVGTGTDAGNYFDVTVKARAFKGSAGVAHA